jgi:Tol biopolymer transport system component
VTAARRARSAPLRRALATTLGLVVLGCGAGPDLPTPTSPDPLPSSTPAPTARATPAHVLDGEPWIVYQGGSAPPSVLRLVRPDGTGDRLLIRTPMPTYAQAQPAWSPDGRFVAFSLYVTQEAGPDRVDLWLVEADGASARELATCELPCLQLADPAWSPDGDRIALVRHDIREEGTWGRSAIELLDVSTGARRTVAETADGTTAFYGPRWSPDGGALAVTVETYPDEDQLAALRSRVATVALDGPDAGRVVPLTPSDLFAAEPDWRPGARIVFATATSPLDWFATASVFVIDVDGRGLLALTTLDDGPGIDPTWLPDGRVMYVASDRVLGQRIALVDPAGGAIELAGWSLQTPAGARQRTYAQLRPVP